MAINYEPHDWISNELITEEKLDHLEQGLANIANNLSDAAETGSYNDLSDKPQINSHELSGNITAKDLGFSTVATSGNYDDLSGKPTNVSQFTNDAGYQNETEVAQKIANANHLKRAIVEQLPEIDGADANTIYMLKLNNSVELNTYAEYMVIEGKWEKLGTSDVDLTNYMKTDAINAALAGKVPTTRKVNGKALNEDVVVSFGDLTGTENVATKEYVGEQIDGIDIGGTNWLRNSTGNLDDTSFWIGGIGFSRNGYNGNNCLVLERTDYRDGVGRKIARNTSVSDLLRTIGVNTNFVVSGYYYIDSSVELGYKDNGNNIFVRFGQENNDQDVADAIVLVFNEDSPRDKWTAFSKVLKVPDHNFVTAYFNVALAMNGRIRFSQLKLELGNKPTDWSPAPEDVDAKIDNIEIGGTNLLPDTRIMNGYDKSGVVTINLDDEGFGVASYNPSNIDWHRLGTKPVIPYSMIRNKAITISIEVRSEDFEKINQGQYEGLYFTLCLCEPNTYSRTKWYNFDYRQKPLTNYWEKATFTIDKLTDSLFKEGDGEITDDMNFFLQVYNRSEYKMQVRKLKMELGNKATDWSPAPEDTDYAISRRSAVTYDYGGRDLKKVFGTPEALHAALAAEDYSNIAVGDYWPITLSGTFWDYGSFAVPSGVKYYSDNGLQTEAGTTAAAYEGLYVSETAVSITISEKTYYVAASECTDHIVRTCNNAAVKLEVAGINHYWRYGDSGDLTGNKNHIVFISRDCLPFWMRMRKANTHWESTAINNPWIGSAMFKTLNDETHGVLPLVAATDVGAYIYAGPNKLGMRAQLETKAPDAANATGWAWYDRGKLFLPSVAEVWGHPFWAEMNWEGGLGNQFAIFRDSRRHISKGGGDNAGRTDWWLGSSYAGNTTNFARFNGGGYASGNAASFTHAVPVCFIFA